MKSGEIAHSHLFSLGAPLRGRIIANRDTAKDHLGLFTRLFDGEDAEAADGDRSLWSGTSAAIGAILGKEGLRSSGLNAYAKATQNAVPKSIARTIRPDGVDHGVG